MIGNQARKLKTFLGFQKVQRLRQEADIQDLRILSERLCGGLDTAILQLLKHSTLEDFIKNVGGTLKITKQEDYKHNEQGIRVNTRLIQWKDIRFHQWTGKDESNLVIQSKASNKLLEKIQIKIYNHQIQNARKILQEYR